MTFREYLIKLLQENKDLDFYSKTVDSYSDFNRRLRSSSNVISDISKILNEEVIEK